MTEARMTEEGRRAIHEIAGKKLLDILVTWPREEENKIDASEAELRMEGGTSVYIFSSVIDILPGIEEDFIDASPRARAVTPPWGRPPVWESLTSLLGAEKGQTVLEVETQTRTLELEGAEIRIEEALAIHLEDATFLFERGMLPLNVALSRISRADLPLSLGPGNATLFQRFCIARISAVLHSHKLETRLNLENENLTWYWVSLPIGHKEYRIEVYPSIAVMRQENRLFDCRMPGELNTISTFVECFARRLDRYLSGGLWEEPGEDDLPEALKALWPRLPPRA